VGKKTLRDLKALLPLSSFVVLVLSAQPVVKL